MLNSLNFSIQRFIFKAPPDGAFLFYNSSGGSFTIDKAGIAAFLNSTANTRFFMLFQTRLAKNCR